MKNTKKQRVILGIDPGTNFTGYSLIEVHCAPIKINVLQIGTIDVSQFSYLLRLKKIYEKIITLFKYTRPDELAIEAPFYGNNVQSMLKLGRVEGMIMGIALHFEVSVTEYAPRKIKSSITGNGGATKEDVIHMLEKNFSLRLKNKYDLNASDALAVAICHAYQSQYIPSKATSWEQFVKQNPQKLKKI